MLMTSCYAFRNQSEPEVWHNDQSLRHMYAYGAITTSGRPKEPLTSTLWHAKIKDPQNAQNVPKYLTIHHLTLATAEKLPGLISYLHNSFAEELERGRTYPQEILQGETYTQQTFEGYFFAADALVAITAHDESLVEGKQDGSAIETTLDQAQNGRNWEDCLAGIYYVSTALAKIDS